MSNIVRLVARKEFGRYRAIGVTDVLCAFNDSSDQTAEIAQVRRELRQLDLAVRDAYGWTDLDLGHGFHAVPYLPENDRIRFTISKPARLEVLRRLSRLNRERWQAEKDAAGAAPGSPAAPRAPARPRLELVSPPGQPDLFE